MLQLEKCICKEQILLRELKNLIQKVEESDINEHIDEPLFTIDHDLKEEKIEEKLQENSNENEIQTSISKAEFEIKEDLDSSNTHAFQTLTCISH